MPSMTTGSSALADPVVGEPVSSSVFKEEASPVQSVQAVQVQPATAAPSPDEQVLSI